MNHQKIFMEVLRKSNIVITVYISLILVPLVIYFIYFGGRLSSQHVMPLLIIASILAVFSQGVLIFIRRNTFLSFQRRYDVLFTLNEREQKHQALQLKKDLLKNAYTESLMYYTSVTLVFLLFYICFHLWFGYIPWLPTATILMGLSSNIYLPVLIFFLVERIMNPLFQIPLIQEQEVDRKSIWISTELYRKIILVTATAITPIFTLSLLLAQATQGLIGSQHLAYHFGVIASISLIYAVVMIYESERNSTNLMSSTVTNLKEGKLSAQNFGINASSEIGFLMQDLNILNMRLRSIIQNVLRSAESVSRNAKQVSGSSNSISASSSEQAANVEETSASLEEITSMINQTTEHSKKTLAMAKETSRYSQDGKQLVEQAVTQMRKVYEKTNLVEEIAGQTNLLALNASIEAARAGEHGRGFSVVASEVGKLAEHSREAAKEITELVRSTLDVSDKAGKFFEIILPQIIETSNLFEQIVSSSVEEEAAVNQINNAMNGLNEIAQNNAAGSEQLSAMADQMNENAQEMLQAAGFFYIEK